MVHLFSAWKEVQKQLEAARHILLLMDYDGTLTPIVEKPELADLPEKARQFLQALNREPHFTVGIISGRALSDLQHRAGISGIVYAGNHGLEIEGPGISFVNPLAEEMKPVFRLIHQILSKALAPVRGASVENKGLTLSVHYRMVDDDMSHELRNVFERVIGTARSLGKVKTTSGKKVYEVRPAVDWDKGKAIELLIERYGRKWKRKGLLPIYMGDDLTDEDGFRVIERYGDGVSIFVGEEKTRTIARYSLRSPSEVEQFLGMLLDMKKPPPKIGLDGDQQDA